MLNLLLGCTAHSTNKLVRRTHLRTLRIVRKYASEAQLTIDINALLLDSNCTLALGQKSLAIRAVIDTEDRLVARPSGVRWLSHEDSEFLALRR